jgi:RNA methyltransferase, TrmH family
MISERKLLSLASGTRLRKIARLLRAFEVDLARGASPDERYLEAILRVAYETLPLDRRPGESAVREANRVRHAILVHLGNDPAEWDLLPPVGGQQEATEWLSGSSASAPVPQSAPTGMRVYLEEIRSPYNVGSIFRTAAAFGVDEILLSEGCASPEHPRAVRSAMGALSMVRFRAVAFEELPRNGLFALETGGIPADEFDFPAEGVVILGNEELGISPGTRETALSSGGICSIALPGAKATLNVSVAFGILMHRWSESARR